MPEVKDNTEQDNRNSVEEIPTYDEAKKSNILKVSKEQKAEMKKLIPEELNNEPYEENPSDCRNKSFPEEAYPVDPNELYNEDARFQYSDKQFSPKPHYKEEYESEEMQKKSPEEYVQNEKSDRRKEYKKEIISEPPLNPNYQYELNKFAKVSLLLINSNN